MTTPIRRRLHDITLTVTLRAPWLVHGNDPGRLGLDAVQLRAPDGKRRLLPGSLLAGRIRDAWRVLKHDFQIKDVPNGEDWFGPPSTQDADEDNDDKKAEADVAYRRGRRRLPKRARILTADLVECSAPPDGLLIHTRVKIDASSGAGRDGMLQAVEQRDAPGSSLSFTGTWRAWLADGEPASLQAHLHKALVWQTQLGALRNIGFGELVAQGSKVHIVLAAAGPDDAAHTAQAAAQQAFVDAEPSPGRARGLRLRFDQPLAVANQLINGNLFQSDDFLPGAALKGALAHAWDQRQPGVAKPAWFDALRFTHAQPSSGTKRPSPLPFSLVAGLEEDQPDARKLIWDLALSSGAASDLIDAHGRAVSFAPDWKTNLRKQAQARQQRAQVARYLRVRTAIDTGQAKQGSLFGYDCAMSPHLGPPGQDGPEPETHWVATLDLPVAFNNPQNWAQIAMLLTSAPLGPLGKTNAFAAVELLHDLEPVWPTRVDPASAGALVRVVLASPALLFASTAVLNNTSVALKEMHEVYAQAFDAIAAATPEADHAKANEPPLALQCFYARQRLAGGEYLAHYFRRPGQPKPYLPYVLTEAGSVFVFQVRDADRAQVVLSHWQQHGLPFSQAVKDEHGDDWRTNPWLAQNGYGEVAVNPDTGFAANLQAARAEALAAAQAAAQPAAQALATTAK